MTKVQQKIFFDLCTIFIFYVYFRLFLYVDNRHQKSRQSEDLMEEQVADVIKYPSSMETKIIDEEQRTIEFIGTNETQDRSGDVIVTDGWDIRNFMANPVFLWAHNGFSMPPIGRALEVSRTPNGLKFKIQFVGADIMPFADTIFKLYKAGFLKGVSVGFVPKKREVLTDPNTGNFVGFKFLEQELIELSAVSVPDNPDALIQEAQHGALQKEAAEFLSKSMYVERTFEKTIQDLKKEILLMATEEKVEETVDKRLENIENRVKQLETFAGEQKAFMEMHKSATEIFTVVKGLLEGLKSGDGDVNPFLKVLGSGTKPDGSPEDMKGVLDAISKATSQASWKPTNEN